jgi:thiamine biosynthesis lipoprotein ApbE
MKTILGATFAMIFATMLLLSGCEKKTAAENPISQGTPGSTKVLEAADLVGYDGKKLRRSVDRLKEANEKHNQQLQKLTDTGPDQ